MRACVILGKASRYLRDLVGQHPRTMVKGDASTLQFVVATCHAKGSDSLQKNSLNIPICARSGTMAKMATQYCDRQAEAKEGLGLN